MPSKYYKRDFHKDLYYHIFNRGVNKMDIFKDEEDYSTYIRMISFYLQKPTKGYRTRTGTVPEETPTSSFSLSAFCLMPNHFHLMVHQHSQPNSQNSIPNFMNRLNHAYAAHFKDKYNHSGSLFESKYKNVPVTTDEQLPYLTKYIHENPRPLVNNGQTLKDYPYSSYPHYLQIQKLDWLTIPPALGDIDPNEYKEFVEEMEQDPSQITTIKID